MYSLTHSFIYVFIYVFRYLFMHLSIYVFLCFFLCFCGTGVGTLGFKMSHCPYHNPYYCCVFLLWVLPNYLPVYDCQRNPPILCPDVLGKQGRALECLDELSAAPLHCTDPAVESGLGRPCHPASKAHTSDTCRAALLRSGPAPASEASVALGKCHPGGNVEPPAKHHCAGNQETTDGSLVGRRANDAFIYGEPLESKWKKKKNCTQEDSCPTSHQPSDLGLELLCLSLPEKAQGFVNACIRRKDGGRCQNAYPHTTLGLSMSLEGLVGGNFWSRLVMAKCWRRDRRSSPVCKSRTTSALQARTVIHEAPQQTGLQTCHRYQPSILQHFKVSPRK
ncbi:uncharacterized protein isoform X2 [Castor canadensis]|uniref:Uncharacterized protein isoform X2 n=1 Tax=Castor canadensis TaxID=51338 RepID=A0AC58KTJ6_CASCN